MARARASRVSASARGLSRSHQLLPPRVQLDPRRRGGEGFHVVRTLPRVDRVSRSLGHTHTWDFFIKQDLG
eukprot:5383462-Prymnesium_polylepis.1